jgi:hypothetical protein
MSVSAQQWSRRAQHSSDGEVGERGHYPLAAGTEPRIAAEFTTLPVNLVHGYVGLIPCRLLVDSGAGVNVLSGEIYRRMRKTLYTVRPKTRHATLIVGRLDTDEGCL